MGDVVGVSVGDAVGASLGVSVGESVGDSVGDAVGATVSWHVCPTCVEQFATHSYPSAQSQAQPSPTLMQIPPGAVSHPWLPSSQG